MRLYSVGYEMLEENVAEEVIYKGLIPSGVAERNRRPALTVESPSMLG